MLERKMYDKMKQWKNKSKGSTALLIDGARRVGKSFIANQFAKDEYKSYIMIDFANCSKELIDLLENETNDLDFFFIKLQALFSTKLYKRESLIIFDEVQQFPKARQLIKYLVADGRYDYIETGSLISLKKNVKDIVIPSEEEHIEMFPLDFEEFLWALGDKTTYSLIKECFDRLRTLGQALHRKILNQFRQYILVGGMPQAVLSYIQDKSFESCDEVKRRIIQLYRSDISKFASGYESKVFSLFDNIPAQLSKKEKRFNLSSINKNARMRGYEESFLWLNEAMITNTCYNCCDPHIGLSLNQDNTTQKCYMSDTGLLISMVFMDRPSIENGLYKSILFDKLSINEGMFMENVVAQLLRSSGHKLFFYSKKDQTNRENEMEIDFLISKGNKISPIEVKSSEYRKHSSLDKFMNKFKASLSSAYILYDKDVMIKDGIIHLPIYMASLL